MQHIVDARGRAVPIRQVSVVQGMTCCLSTRRSVGLVCPKAHMLHCLAVHCAQQPTQADRANVADLVKRVAGFDKAQFDQFIDLAKQLFADAKARRTETKK